MIGSMYDELSGLGELADMADGEKAKEIAEAISSGIKNITSAAKGGGHGSGEPIPIQNVILILGGTYLAYKILSTATRE